MHMSAQIPKFGHHTPEPPGPAAATGQEAGNKRKLEKIHDTAALL